MPIPSSSDPAAFHAFEQERWQSAPRAYHDAFGSLTSQAVEPLLDAARVGPGVRHLDLASGPGYGAARSAARGAQVTGADFSDTMVALARSLHRGIEFREADAEALPFEDASFDVITMGFLLGHLARPGQAVNEAFRVLRPGGRLAVSWWLPPDRAKGFEIVMEPVKAYGRLDVGLPEAPPFDLFGNPAVLRQVLAEAGFSSVEVRELDLTWRVGSGEELFEAYLRGTARTAGLLVRQAPEALARIRADVIERCRPWARAGGLEIPMPAHVASGMRG